MTTKTSFFLTLAPLLVFSCAPVVETQPVSAALAPAKLVAGQVGDTWVRQKNGKQETTKLVSLDGKNRNHFNETSGCSWSDEHPFAPSAIWENCDGKAGTQKSVRNGEIFPLQVGNTMSWEFTGQNKKGEDWKGTRNCKVEDTARVTAPVGTFDTYNIRCEDKWRVRNWYYAPETGQTVIFTNLNKSEGTTERSELVSFTPGDA